MDSPVVTIGEELKAQLNEKLNKDSSLDPAQRSSSSADDFRRVEADAYARQQEAAKAQPTALSNQTIPDLDQRMSKLGETSRRLQQERESFKQEQARFQQDMAELQQLRELRARAKEDPVAWAEAGGYEAPDVYATTLMEKGALTPERKKILELEKKTREQDEWRNSFEAKQAAEQQAQQERQVMAGLQDFSQQAGEKYDLVNRYGAHNQVLQVIKDHYNKTMDLEAGSGEILSYDQAFQVVEDFIDKQLEVASQSPKFRARFGTASAAGPAGSPTSQPAARQVGTVSSRMRASSTPEAPMSEAERLQKAGEYLFSQLRRR